MLFMIKIRQFRRSVVSSVALSVVLSVRHKSQRRRYKPLWCLIMHKVGIPSVVRSRSRHDTAVAAMCHRRRRDSAPSAPSPAI